MKNLTHYFNEKGILFKEIEAIDLKNLKSRKKIEIYTAEGIDKNYYAIFIHNPKSRFIKKNAEELIELCSTLAQFKEHNFKKKILLITTPICSKAKEFLKQNSWKVETNYKIK
ncbi:MAG: hypothetical protein WC141_01855 [Arcobacteraceae bacterium]